MSASSARRYGRPFSRNLAALCRISPSERQASSRLSAQTSILLRSCGDCQRLNLISCGHKESCSDSGIRGNTSDLLSLCQDGNDNHLHISVAAASRSISRFPLPISTDAQTDFILIANHWKWTIKTPALPVFLMALFYFFFFASRSLLPLLLQPTNQPLIGVESQASYLALRSVLKCGIITHC